MKKQLLTIALLAGALTASAGVNLVVSGQQQQSFAVGDIGKITFTESTMDVYGKDSGRRAMRYAFGPDSYRLPIPQAAMDQNPNLVQNPGY